MIFILMLQSYDIVFICANIFEQKFHVLQHIFFRSKDFSVFYPLPMVVSKSRLDRRPGVSVLVLVSFSAEFAQSVLNRNG